MSNLNFKQQFDKEYKDIIDKANKVIKTVAVDAWKLAVYWTPHDTYRAKNSWQLNTRRTGLIPAMGKYPRNPKIPILTFDLRKNKFFNLYNNVPYISYLEHGQGIGRRTAHKMLFKATRYLEINLQRELDKIK